MAVKENMQQRRRRRQQRRQRLAGRTRQQCHGVQCALAFAKYVGCHLIVLLLCIDSTEREGMQSF